MQIRKNAGGIVRTRRQEAAKSLKSGENSESSSGTQVALLQIVANPEIKLVSPEVSERPVQDEWGFYDPEQAGFEAVLRKLTSASDDEADSRPSASAIAR